MTDETKEPAGQRTATVRLLPLPSLVMFPHVLQLLHVHEPRYRQLVSDTLLDDGQLSTVLLRSGWEPDYDRSPRIAATVCVTRIASQVLLPDGSYNIVLQGLGRGRVCQEVAAARAYRQAEVELLKDVVPEQDAPRRLLLRRALLDAFQSCLPDDEKLPYQVEQLLSSQVPLGVLTDILAFTLQLSLPTKQALLDQVNVQWRAEVLCEQLEHLQHRTARPFPPPFSVN